MYTAVLYLFYLPKQEPYFILKAHQVTVISFFVVHNIILLFSDTDKKGAHKKPVKLLMCAFCSRSFRLYAFVLSPAETQKKEPPPNGSYPVKFEDFSGAAVAVGATWGCCWLSLVLEPPEAYSISSSMITV